jgi:hypothetical protein
MWSGGGSTMMRGHGPGDRVTTPRSIPTVKGGPPRSNTVLQRVLLLSCPARGGAPPPLPTFLRSRPTANMNARRSSAGGAVPAAAARPSFPRPLTHTYTPRRGPSPAAAATAARAAAGNSAAMAAPPAAPPAPAATTVAPPFDAASVARLAPCRQGAVVPYAPLEGPGVWRASDFPDPSAWTVDLTPAHIAELEAAVRGVLASGAVTARDNNLDGVRAGRGGRPGLPAAAARRGAARARAPGLAAPPRARASAITPWPRARAFRVSAPRAPPPRSRPPCPCPSPVFRAPRAPPHHPSRPQPYHNPPAPAPPPARPHSGLRAAARATPAHPAPLPPPLLSPPPPKTADRRQRVPLQPAHPRPRAQGRRPRGQCGPRLRNAAPPARGALEPRGGGRGLLHHGAPLVGGRSFLGAGTFGGQEACRWRPGAPAAAREGPDCGRQARAARARLSQPRALSSPPPITLPPPGASPWPRTSGSTWSATSRCGARRLEPPRPPRAAAIAYS